METYSDLDTDGGNPAPMKPAMEEPRTAAATGGPSIVGPDAPPAPQPGTAAGARKRKAPTTATAKARMPQVEEPIQMPVYYGLREMFDSVQGDDLVEDSLDTFVENNCAHVIGELPLQPQSMSLVDLQLWIFKLFRLHPETQDLSIKVDLLLRRLL
ncbi:uncharacterized protein LOC125541121 [Triticum urartu]|uniref:uncharacterized protein LOC125541121 n=1 Tax=Triticum urartu TaxID=4572 RepID=UPI0020445313|nr:uncharacterized protein LOC125541121 [Triticum urartu]